MSQEGSNGILEDNSPASPTSPDPTFHPKQKSKLIRVLTVLAYMLSVSMAAILLSAYYIFMYDSQPTLAQKTYPAPLTQGRNFHEYEQYMYVNNKKYLKDKGVLTSNLKRSAENETEERKDWEKIENSYEMSFLSEMVNENEESQNMTAMVMNNLQNDTFESNSTESNTKTETQLHHLDNKTRTVRKVPVRYSMLQLLTPNIRKVDVPTKELARKDGRKRIEEKKLLHNYNETMDSYPTNLFINESGLHFQRFNLEKASVLERNITSKNVTGNTENSNNEQKSMARLNDSELEFFSMLPTKQENKILTTEVATSSVETATSPGHSAVVDNIINILYAENFTVQQNVLDEDSN